MIKFCFLNNKSLWVVKKKKSPVMLLHFDFIHWRPPKKINIYCLSHSYSPVVLSLLRFRTLKCRDSNKVRQNWLCIEYSTCNFLCFYVEYYYAYVFLRAHTLHRKSLNETTFKKKFLDFFYRMLWHSELMSYVWAVPLLMWMSAFTLYMT